MNRRDVDRHLPGERYKALNVTCYPKYGTVEVRLHQGTLSAEKITAWVDFGQALIAWAKAGAPMMTYGVGRADMLTALTAAGGLSDTVAAYLEGRATELARRGPVSSPPPDYDECHCGAHDCSDCYPDGYECDCGDRDCDDCYPDGYECGCGGRDCDDCRADRGLPPMDRAGFPGCATSADRDENETRPAPPPVADPERVLDRPYSYYDAQRRAHQRICTLYQTRPWPTVIVGSYDRLPCTCTCPDCRAAGIHPSARAVQA